MGADNHLTVVPEDLSQSDSKDKTHNGKHNQDP
jgi:hypothetical protein